MIVDKTRILRSIRLSFYIYTIPDQWFLECVNYTRSESLKDSVIRWRFSTFYCKWWYLYTSFFLVIPFSQPGKSTLLIWHLTRNFLRIIDTSFFTQLPPFLLLLRSFYPTVLISFLHLKILTLSCTEWPSYYSYRSSTLLLLSFQVLLSDYHLPEVTDQSSNYKWYVFVTVKSGRHTLNWGRGDGVRTSKGLERGLDDLVLTIVVRVLNRKLVLELKIRDPQLLETQFGDL